jgi:hypothetical protein
VRIALIAVSVVLALTACESADAHDTKAAAQAVVTCAEKAQEVALPQGFPASFPLPERTVVIGSEQRSEGRLIVTAISADPEPDVLAFLQAELPKAGYVLSGGEVESGDAESDWSSPSRQVRGRWAIREIPGCDKDTVITVLSAPTTPHTDSDHPTDADADADADADVQTQPPQPGRPGHANRRWEKTRGDIDYADLTAPSTALPVPPG